MTKKHLKPPREREFDPSPDDGDITVDGDDDPSLPNAEPGGGRGPGWSNVYPAKAKRCTGSSKRRTQAARDAGLIGPDEFRRCRNVATKESSTCRFHGGTVMKMQKGTKGWHGNLHTGRYSPRLGKLREAYEAAITSPTLFDLREGISVMDACVQNMMDRVDEGDTPAFRSRTLELFRNYQAADIEGRDDDADAILTELGDLLQRGADHDQSIETLVRSVDTLQKRIEEAWKIKLTKDDTLNTRDLLGILAHVIEAVMDEAGGQVGTKIVERIDSLITGYGSALRTDRLLSATSTETS